MIELLVVISIIAALFAILLPAFQNMRANAKAKQEQMEAAGYNNAVQAFRTEYGFTPGEEPGGYSSQADVIEHYLLSGGDKNPHHISFWEKK